MNSTVINFLWAALLHVLLFLLIVIIIDYSAKIKRRAVLKNLLNEVAVANRFHFKETDFLSDRLIAFDPHYQALAFIWLGKPPLIIDLKTVAACKIYERHNKRRLRTIELQLIGKHHGLINALPIYKSGYDNELLLSHFEGKAKKWQQIITDALSWTITIENRLKISD